MRFLSFYYFGFLLFNLIFLGCGKKPNAKLANTYYKSCLLELGEKDFASENLKKALHFIDLALEHEQNPKYLALKASLLFQLGQVEQGDKLFKQVLSSSINAGFKAETLNNYACLLTQHGQQDKALQIWSDLQNNKDYLTPEVALFNQSKLYISQNKYEKARELLKKSIFEAPSYLDAHYCLALVAFKLKEIDLCKKEVSTILYLEPEHQGAKKLLDLLSIKRNH